MIDIVKVALLCLAASVFAVYLRQQKREFAVVFSIVVCLMIVLLLITPIYDTFKELYEMVLGFGIDGSYLLTIAKVIGISYITAITASIARDCGETAISTKMDIAGKIAIVVATVPAIGNVLEQINVLLN